MGGWIFQAFALALAGLVFLGSCAGHGSARPDSPSSTLPDSSGLPSIASLSKQASGYRIVFGSDVYDQRGGTINGNYLVLGGGGDDGGGPISTSAVDHSASAEPSAELFSYGIYLIGGINETVAAATVAIVADYETPVWLGVADWKRGVWDFSAGYFLASPGVAFEDLPGGAAPYVSDSGQVALALVLPAGSAPITVQRLEVTMLTEVLSAQASDNRWDGVLLTWETEDTTNGYTIYRRPANNPQEAWLQLMPVALSKSTSSYLDGTAADSVEYDYRVSVAYRRFISGIERWFHSPGLVVTGHRQPTSFNPGGTISFFTPACLYNYISYFYALDDEPSKPLGIRNTAFPAEGEWELLSSSPEALGGITLQDSAGFAPPFDVYQSSSMNATVAVLGYSNSNGLFSQTLTISEQGEIAWEEPIKVRDAPLHFLGYIQLPRRIGAVAWNPAANRMELVDSRDLYGRAWYEFAPDVIPWMVVSTRVPDGALDMEYFVSGESISYLEKDTHQMVVLLRAEDGWHDLSPGITSPVPPMLGVVMPPGHISTYGLIYLQQDGKRIKLLRMHTDGTWLTNEIGDLLIMKGNNVISEFALSATGDLSYSNYLTFVMNGQLYVCYTNHPALEEFSKPRLVDSSTDCRQLSLIKVGTDASYLSNYFATYITNAPDGSEQVNFRDLKQVLNN